jgi:hypothetical protein
MQAAHEPCKISFVLRIQCRDTREPYIISCAIESIKGHGLPPSKALRKVQAGGDPHTREPSGG